jgi:hypothetical protein
MPLTLQDLYAEPRFIENVEQPIAAEIMTREFPTPSSDAVDSMKAKPIAVSIDKVEFSNEKEERIEGEVIVSARIATRAKITLASKVRTAGGIEDSTQVISQDFRGLMNFRLPWSWQERSIEFVLKSVQIALRDLQIA